MTRPEHVTVLAELMDKLFGIIEHLEASRAALEPFAKLAGGFGDVAQLQPDDLRQANEAYHTLCALLENPAASDVPVLEAREGA